MRNLKRALSLAVASVMLLGMMVVGSSAASYSDVADTDNVEAIAVMKAAGIMIGDESGKFNPDKNVTRNEMAVVMANMMGLDVEDYEGTAPFTDVPAWAEPYVSACYANGIVSGASATSYNGAASVTAVEAGLMMMKALGYFAYQGDFGDDWKIATVKQASKISLFDDISAGTNAALTRNEVAQLALNALESDVVEGESNSANTNITAGDVSISITGKTTYYKVAENKDDYNGSDDGIQQVIEKLYDEDFTKDTDAEDALGMPGTEWYDEEEDEAIVFVADEADEIVVATEATTTNALYVEEVDDDYEYDTENDTSAAVVAGDVVYYFVEKDEIEEAVVVHYELVQIVEIDDDMKKAEIEDGYSFEVTLSNNDELYDTEFAGFDYEEDDYVLVAYSTDGDEIVLSELAESIEGKVTGKKSGEFKIGGKYYEDLSGDVATGLEAVYYLNKAGQIILVTDIEDAKSDDYAYIYNIVENDGDMNEDGVDGDGTYTAYLVLADGSKDKYVIEEDSVELAEKDTVVAYSVNKDDELVIEESSDEIAALEAVTLDKSNKYVVIDGTKIYADSKTEFVFASWEKKKMVVTTETGIKNVEIEAEDVFVVYDEEDKDVLFVFVMAEAEAIKTETTYAVMLADGTDVSKDENEDEEWVYTYEVYADGDETTLTFESDVLADLKAGDVFAYIIDGDYAELDEDALIEATVDYIGEDFIEIGGVEYTYDDAEISTIVYEYDADGELTDVYVSSNDKIEVDDTVIFEANSDEEILVAYVIEIDD